VAVSLDYIEHLWESSTRLPGTCAEDEFAAARTR
jgi:hypothetical protein